MARRLAVALLLLPVAAACGLPGAPTTASQRVALQPAVKVAVVGTFSGPSTVQGRSVRNSLQVEADALNANGGVLGSRVEVVAADSEGSPAKAAELVRQQLADGDVKLLVGPNFTAGYLAVKQSIVQARVPNCVTSVAGDALTGATFSFRSDASERSSVATLFAYLRQSRPEIKKVGLLDDGDETAQTYDRQLAEQAAHFGVTYTGRATASDADPRPAVQQVLAQGPQAVVLAAEPAAAARISQAIQQVAGNTKPQILGFHGLSGYEFPSLAGDTAVNSVLANTNEAYLTNVPESSWPAGYRDFVRTLTRQYGYATNGVDINGDPAAADCLRQWAKGATRAGTFQGPDVVRAWETLDLDASETVLGVRERLSAADHNAVGQTGLMLYSWAKEGNRYRLRQLATPAV